MKLLTVLAVPICHECGKYSVHASYCQIITVEVAEHSQPITAWMDIDGLLPFPARTSVACQSTEGCEGT